MDDGDKQVVYHEHTFFWNTILTEDEMKAIVRWIASLGKDERKLLDLLIADVRNNEEWDALDDG